MPRVGSSSLPASPPHGPQPGRRSYLPEWASSASKFGRPTKTTRLTPDNYDQWVDWAVTTKRTAFVRWILPNDSKLDCSWALPSSEGDHDGPVSPTELGRKLSHIYDDPVGGFHVNNDGRQRLLDDDSGRPPPIQRNTMQPDTEDIADLCDVVRQQAQIWDTIVYNYKDDPSVEFADVILADWSDVETVEDTSSLFANERSVMSNIEGCSLRCYNE